MLEETSVLKIEPESPLGATVLVNGVESTVVVVVVDVRKVSLTSPLSPTICLPLAPYPTENLRLAVRGLAALLPARRIIAFDPARVLKEE